MIRTAISSRRHGRIPFSRFRPRLPLKAEAVVAVDAADAAVLRLPLSGMLPQLHLLVPHKRPVVAVARLDVVDAAVVAAEAEGTQLHSRQCRDADNVAPNRAAEG